MGLSAIGPVMQLAFVPPDFDAAVRHWTEVMGVGPFHLIENIRLERLRYLGEPNDCVFSIALAYWGDVQIELIRQENDTPSLYRDRPNGGRLHHVCILTDDLAGARRIAEEAGCALLVEAQVGADGGVIYVDSHGFPGGIVEILQPATGGRELFAMIRQACRDWDGQEPLRRL